MTWRSYELITRVFEGKTEGLTRDDILDNISLYWLTNTAISSARLYWERAFQLAASLREGRQASGRRERLSGRDLPSPAKLGGAGVSQTHLLQPAPTRAAISRPGSSRNFLCTMCAWDSNIGNTA